MDPGPDVVEPGRAELAASVRRDPEPGVAQRQELEALVRQGRARGGGHSRRLQRVARHLPQAHAHQVRVPGRCNGEMG